MRVTEPGALGVRHGLAKATAHLARESSVIADIMKMRFYPFVLDRADDGYLFDIDGNRYLDFCAGGAVMNVGYRNAAVVNAIEQAAAGPWSTTSAIFAHPAQTELAIRLNDLVPGDTKVWFGTSGSEAMDTIGRYFRTASGRRRIVSFTGAFHGQTGGSGALSGMESHSDLAADYVTRVPYPYPYRCAHGPCDSDGCALACLRPVREALGEAPDEISGIVVEAVQSDAGEIVPPRNFLPALRELADEHGVWLGLDEVKVGFGRTGRMFAYEHAEIVPDAVAIGKAMSGGLPLSAVIGLREILDARVGTHAYTLAGSPQPCAAGLAVLDEIERQDLVANAATMGERLLQTLRARTKDCPIVGEVRGQGLVLGLELVLDRASRSPAPEHAQALARRCFELGLIVIVMGIYGNVIELTPPLAVSDREADLASEIIGCALDDVVEGRVGPGALPAG